MPSRKRTYDEVESSDIAAAAEPSLLQRVRNCWQFASLMQYIQIFGTAAKIPDEVDVDLLEEECLKVPHSEKLTEIGLCMLRMVSSHRGLTPDIFDEYTRRQYVAKAPLRNPFGEDEVPVRFADMDIFSRLDVLHQLSIWTFFNEDRMRDRMRDKDSSEQSTNWRISPIGWDADDRQYYVLDDNRLYRLTPPPLPPAPKAKAKPKKKLPAPPPPRPKGSRSSKRQRIMNGLEDDDVEDEVMAYIKYQEQQDQQKGEETEPEQGEPEDNGLGGAKWELLAITLDEYRIALEAFKKSRDPNEKALFRYYEEEVSPALERVAASNARKAAARQRELEAMAKMVNAKRSSRISSRQQQQKEAEEAMATERRRKEELFEAQRQQERQLKMEVDRESRMMTREQRLKDREMKRILHEAEVEKLRDGSEASEGHEGRVSERHRKARLEQSQLQLDQLREEEDEDWDFDCAVCGVHGKNLDDGTHSMACERCGVWQHSACHGISADKAESDDFHFVCVVCSKPRPKPAPESESEARVTTGANVNGSSTASAPTQNGHSAPRISQHQRNGSYSHGQTISSTPQLPSQTFQQPHSAPQWQTQPSPSKPLTPQNPALQHNRSFNPHQPFVEYRTPSFEDGRTVPSPAPKLSATQGSTGIRFSPTHAQNGVLSGSSQAYTPTSNRPNAAAYSPTKKGDSSPPQPQVGRLSSPSAGRAGGRTSPLNLNAGQPAESRASPLPSASAGLSPVKHDVPSSPSLPMSLSAAGVGLGLSGATPGVVRGGDRPFALGSAKTLEPLGAVAAPSLSPKLHADAADRNPPVKRSSPKMPSLPAAHMGPVPHMGIANDEKT